MHLRALGLTAALLAFAATSAPAATIYSATFTGGVTTGLTGSTTVATAPSGQQFVELAPNGGTATLTLNTAGLSDVMLSFNLYTIRSVDGSNADYGPDFFEVQVNDVTVLKETFANFYAWTQSYGGPGSPAGTGSSATGALGYPEFFGYDHTYDLSFAVGAPGTTTKIEFISLATQAVNDESFGIDNILVTGTSTDGGIPEPATWALMVLGFGAAGSILRRRRLDHLRP